MVTYGNYRYCLFDFQEIKNRQKKLFLHHETGLWMIRSVYTSERDERPKLPIRDIHGFKIIRNLESDSPLLKIQNERPSRKNRHTSANEAQYGRNWPFVDPGTGPSFVEFVSKN